MSTLLALGRSGSTLTGLDITDMHSHMGAFGFAIPALSVESLIQVMDRLGVARMVCSHIRCLSADTSRGNHEVLQAMRAYPGRILGYAACWPTSPEVVRAEVESCLRAGFTGIKVHNGTGFPYTHPAYQPAYALAHELRRPVLFHTWGGGAEFAEIAQLSQRYPDATLQLAHSGCSNEAGYIQMVQDCPNVYLDFVFSRAPRGLVERLVAAVGAERLVWGSDANFFSMPQQLGRVLGARISDDNKRTILSGTARGIFERMVDVGTG